MKHEAKHGIYGGWSGVVVVLALLAAVLPAPAELPVPSFVYYGEVIDAYGWPLMASANAYVIARVGERECGRAAINEARGPAINYRVEVPVDDGQDQHYAGYAARPGDPVTLTVLRGGVEYPVMDASTIPPVGQPGGMTWHSLCTGHDEDNDGLPDEWENWIIAWSGGSLTNINQVHGADDADGDGMSNLHEFFAGTDPAWDVDFFHVVETCPIPAENRVGLAFFSVPGKTYRVSAAPSIVDVFGTVEVSTSPSALAADRYWRGDGYHAWLYVNANTNLIFRVLRMEVE